MEKDIELINYIIEDLEDIISNAANEEDVLYRKRLLDFAKKKKEELESNFQIIKVPMRNGHNIIVDINHWNDEYPDDICVYFEKDNVILQDIVVAREHKSRDAVEVLVYADDYNEDYTNKFTINEHNFKEDM